jgi:hypothetical protein
MVGVLGIEYIHAHGPPQRSYVPQTAIKTVIWNCELQWTKHLTGYVPRIADWNIPELVDNR